jgi:hypothetical protein
VICGSVAFHLTCVFMAARFEGPALMRAAWCSGIGLYLVAGPLLWLWHRTTMPERPDEGLSDIRDVIDGERPPYAPETYFSIPEGIFAGLDDNRLPIYVPWKQFRKTHMQVVGTTGSGKGVATTMLLIQCALAGECVVVFDPKDDEFAPNVMARAAADAGIPFHLLDLRPQAPPQFNIFRNCTSTDIEELLMTGFDMGDKGNSADFYRLFDRAAARDVCARSGANPTMRGLVDAANRSTAIDDEKGIKFKADLEELAGLQAINTTEGLDLSTALSQQGFLYIVGSIRNVQTIRCQRMLLLRIMQIIEQRDRKPGLRYVAMMLDELKYLLSKPALQALGTVRDKSCHVMLAHQSLADLRDCEGLDPLAVTGAVVENTSLKLIYKAVSPQTADWASDLSGKIIVGQQSTSMQQSMFDAANGSYHEVERALLTRNDILTMPPLVGMLFGAGLSRRAQVATMKSGQRPAIVPAESLSGPDENTPSADSVAAMIQDPTPRLAVTAAPAVAALEAEEITSSESHETAIENVAMLEDDDTNFIASTTTDDSGTDMEAFI